MIGKTISHYKILEKLGEGGMGVVYKAEDTKLKRTVALKFLPQNLTRDEESKERFIHEAQAASALEHNNICNIHEIGETDDDQMFICMAYYEGETLKKKIERGPLKIEDAIDIGLQIAEGIGKTHEKGIVHRDLKPANVMMIPNGRDEVKIVDFGLAKLAGRTKITKTGTTVGTVAYMSPEQLRGEVVDHRSDIWSLGVMIYEMVAGRVPFKGDYEQAVTYSILNEEPEPLTGLRTGVPMDLERIVAKAMAKEPDERYQHVDELPVDLKTIEAWPSSISRISATRLVATDVARRVPWRRGVIFGLAGLVLGTLAGAAVWQWFQPKPLAPVTRFVIAPPANERRISRTGATLALSPDGKKFVYVGSGEQGTQLYVRSMDQLDARAIPGTDGASTPFFSPDGEWLGFLADSKLKKVALTGGPPFTITEASGDVRGASWGSNDVIVFAPASGLGLSHVSAAGGEAVAISIPDRTSGEFDHRWPEVLPGGRAVLYTSWTANLANAKIGLLSLETGEVKLLVENGAHAHYAASGHLVYGSAGQTLLAAPFDIERLQVTGPPIPILENILIKGGGAGEFALSHTGSLLYLPATAGNQTIVWVDRKGTTQPLMEKPGHFHYPRLSPDGTRLAVSYFEGSNHDIWVYNLLQQGTFSRLTFEGDNVFSTWTPDGQRVAFSSAMAGGVDMYWVPADGSGQAEPLLTANGRQVIGSWSPDGKFLVFDEGGTGLRDIKVLPLDETKPWTYLGTPFDEQNPMLSPDGRWLAYTSNESGRYEVYVRDFPQPGARWQISDKGGSEPLWARDGKELFYRSDNQLVAVVIETEPIFTVGRREVLFEDPFAGPFRSTNYDIHPNGDRFVMIDRGQEASQFVAVLNWFEELKRKVPRGK